jgi:hypothetical protein
MFPWLVGMDYVSVMLGNILLDPQNMGLSVGLKPAQAAMSLLIVSSGCAPRKQDIESLRLMEEEHWALCRSRFCSKY